MKSFYRCEMCDKVFDKRKDCIEHEKNCHPTPIKMLNLGYDCFEHQYELTIIEYLKAFKQNNNCYKLNPRWNDRRDLRFGVIQSDDGGANFYIYTLDFSPEHEKLLLEKLKTHFRKTIKFEQQVLEDKIKDLDKPIKENERTKVK